jgi:hypothetical protein
MELNCDLVCEAVGGQNSYLKIDIKDARKEPHNEARYLQ